MALKLRESLDTNIILRIMLRDVPEQCLRIVDLLMRRNVVYEVEDLAIMEAVYVMQNMYGLPRKKIVEGIRKLDWFSEISYNKGLFERVLPMYLECSQLSFSDCCLAGYAAMKEAEPLWTFDRDLAKVSGTAKMLR